MNSARAVLEGARASNPLVYQLIEFCAGQMPPIVIDLTMEGSKDPEEEEFVS